MKLKFLNSLFLSCLVYSAALAQDKTMIDQIAAVVGSEIILHSEIEQQYEQFLAQGNYANDGIKCEILQNLLLGKLLVQQAQIDSIEVTDAQVESEVMNRMDYYINQIGSEEKLEQYFNKSIAELKDELRPMIKEQMLTQQMQSKISGKVNATPSDVKEFYESIPADSLPYINSEIEYEQIFLKVPVSKEEKDRIIQQLEEYRSRVKDKGDDFATLAVLYSQDPGSAKKGGELGYVNRTDLVPEFSAAAFKLKAGEMSSIIETKFGFHLIQLIDRKGERINARHILIKPKIKDSDYKLIQDRLDSISIAVLKDSISFEEAALQFSEDVSSKNNGGLVYNRNKGSSRFEADNMDPQVFFTLDKLSEKEMSAPVQASDSD
ncbi:MAG TPA: peptidylprolyl isomerase, partial [Bacteroidia bacterium]|nr:peptidylprolyl isomerase [Bacteroidia bacterium]